MSKTRWLKKVALKQKANTGGKDKFKSIITFDASISVVQMN
jgi:hypothetical protein